jgi:hypothetical protein
VVAVIVVVTGELGPTSVAELEARQEAREARRQAIEERREARQERLEERAGG